MKINAPKKQKFYLKNSYASQIMKPQKHNNQYNVNSQNLKITSNYNIHQSLNFNPKKIFFNKKSLYQNCYPNKSLLVKVSSNYLSQKNIHNKSTKKYKDKPISLAIITDPNISGRKNISKNYEIINPFKERSNSENKINCFNRTYTFFNNNDNNQISYIKALPNLKNNQMKKSVDKISINLSDISYKNLPTKLYQLTNENKNKNNISPIQNKNNNKKYFYQDKITKKNSDVENYDCTKLQKKPNKPTSPLVPKNVDDKNVTSPNSINSNNTLKIEKKK